MGFLIWIQDSAFSTWIRESDWAIFAILIVHTLAMACLAGTGTAAVLRVLGIAAGVPLALLARLVPVMVVGLITAIVSGILLVIGYPAKALTNPLFYIKMGMLLAAWLATRRLLRRVLVDSRIGPSASSVARRIAIASLVLWLIVIVAGKFLAYTNKMLLVY